MKTFSDNQIKLIQLLSDGLCHSGNELGEHLHVSRTAIWKQITQLSELGLAIQRIPQQGYRLNAPLILLNEERINQALSTCDFDQPWHVHLFASVDSTNRYLKDLPHSNQIDVCITEQQTEGRGRFGRHWHSPFGENMYLSCRWHFDSDLSRLSGLSLVVSLAVIAALNAFGMVLPIQVKWPNDILWNHKKLCGCLIEIVAESNSNLDVIIGIGLNVNSVTSLQPLIDKAWCSLHDITGCLIDRNPLIACVLAKLNQFLQLFMEHGFAAFLPEWHLVDYLQGQTITVSHPVGALSGTARGVNEMGQLILEDTQGAIHYLSSGDTSLKR